MNNSIKLHTNPNPLNFSGLSRSLEEADFVFLGVPFDGTVSYKPGCRFGPNSIRELSMNIETQSIRTGIDLEDVRIHDLGDLNVVPGDVSETLRRLEAVINDLQTPRRIPLIAGGEHTLTLPVIKSLSDVSLLHFDAHGDLRDEYLGEKVCHATVMRRISEIIPPSQMLQVGIRALCKEEVEYVKASGIHQITAQEILESGIEAAIKQARNWAAHAKKIYISVDLDVFDAHLGRASAAAGRLCPGQGQAQTAQPGGQAAETENLQELLTGKTHDRSSQKDVPNLLFYRFQWISFKKKSVAEPKKRRNRL